MSLIHRTSFSPFLFSSSPHACYWVFEYLWASNSFSSILQLDCVLFNTSLSVFFYQVIQSPFLWLYLLAFLYGFFFPRTLHALVSGVPFLISAVDLFSVASQSFLPVEISAWNENMLAMQSCMEIYNVLLYGEISHLQILFFSNLSWLLFFPLYSTTWSLESFCHVQRKKSNWNFNWKCIKLINLAMIAFYF